MKIEEKHHMSSPCTLMKSNEELPLEPHILSWHVQIHKNNIEQLITV